jgi:hypothetical protein
MTAPADAKNVKETWIAYDTVRIRDGLSAEPNGNLLGYNSFALLAAAQEVPFLNMRNSSQAGLQYCNLDKTDSLAWPFDAESIGIEFVYPTPYNSQIAVSADAAAKIFLETIPNHCALIFSIRQDDRLIIRPNMCPPGYGPYGAMAYQSSFNHAYAQIATMGVPNMGNRFQWLGEPLEIPRDTPIKARLVFSEYGKRLLNALSLNPLDFNEGPTGEIPNEAQIVVSLRGQRYVQQRGEYHT